MYEHNALGYWSGLALCLTKVRSSRARCPATALILQVRAWFLSFIIVIGILMPINSFDGTIDICVHVGLQDICMKIFYCEKLMFVVNSYTAGGI